MSPSKTNDSGDRDNKPRADWLSYLLGAALLVLVGLVIYASFHGPDAGAGGASGENDPTQHLLDQVDNDLSRNDFDAAIDRLTQRIADQGPSVILRRRLADALLRAGVDRGDPALLTEALGNAEAILAERPGDRWAHWIIGEILYRTGQPGWREHWRQGRSTEDPELLSQLGSSYLVAGEVDTAAELLERSLGAQPENLRALEAMADVCRLRGQPAQAAQYLGRALALRPGSARLRVKLAMVQVQQGRPDQAERTLAPVADHPAAAVTHALVTMQKALAAGPGPQRRAGLLRAAELAGRAGPEDRLAAVLLGAQALMHVGDPEHLRAAGRLVAEAVATAPNDPRVAGVVQSYRRLRGIASGRQTTTAPSFRIAPPAGGSDEEPPGAPDGSWFALPDR
jgi:tetratricopeptide (TPR) repeat protein